MDILKFEEQSSVFYNRSRTDRGYVNQFKVGFAKHSSFAVTDKHGMENATIFLGSINYKNCALRERDLRMLATNRKR